MDELALLKDFRLEDAAPDGAREHARAALRATMTPSKPLPPPPLRDRARFGPRGGSRRAAYAIVHRFVVGRCRRRACNIKSGSTRRRPLRRRSRSRARARTGPPARRSSVRPPRLRGPCNGRRKCREGGDCQSAWYAGKHRPHGGPITSVYCGFGKSVTRARSPTLRYEGLPRESVLPARRAMHPAHRVRIGNRVFKTPFGWFVAMYKGPRSSLRGAPTAASSPACSSRRRREERLPPRRRRPSPRAPRAGRPHTPSSHADGLGSDRRPLTPAGRTFKWVHTVTACSARNAHEQGKGPASTSIVDPRGAFRLAMLRRQAERDRGVANPGRLDDVRGTDRAGPKEKPSSARRAKTSRVLTCASPTVVPHRLTSTSARSSTSSPVRTTRPGHRPVAARRPRRPAAASSGARSFRTEG